MSMLQCKKWPLLVPERYKYLSKLFILSAALHGFFFIVILFLYQMHFPNKFTVVINQRMNEAKIVFIPTLKTVPGSLTSFAQKNNKQSPKKIACASIKKIKKKLLTKKVIPVKPKKPLKTKIQTSKTTITKNLSKPQPKKVEPKKNEIKPQQKPKPQITEQKKLIEKLQPKELKKITSQSLEKTTDTKQDVIYLGREDKALLDLYNQVQEEVEKVWHPPAGVSKDLACSIKVKIDKKGSILDLATKNSSNVISYDIAARTALDKISFPKNLWGKEVVITFKQ